MINGYMEAVIASQLTNVILQALGIIELKAAAYKCVYALAKYFYVEAFQSISEKAINAALTDLGQINDDNLHDEIFEFIRAIAISEKLNQINNGIIQNCLQPILQASIMLTVKFFDSYDTDRYTSSSIQLLGILAKEFPQLTLNIYLQNADQQINNQNEQLRALALYLYLFVVENCDIYDPNNPVESLILNIYEKTCSVLNTQSTQIYLRDTVLKLLCEIAKKSDAFNMKVSECVPIIMSSIQISNSTAFSAFNTLININFYPHISEYVIYLLQLLTTPNPNFSYAVGQTIIHMIEHLKNYNELEALIANFHTFFMMSFQQPELNRNQEDIFSIYPEFCTKGQNLMLPYLSSDLEMFIQHFNIHHDPMILDVLTIIAISYSSIYAFDKYLNQLLEMILLFLNDPMNNININYAFRSLTDLMKRRFPISHSFPILFKLILNIMNTRKNDFNIYLSFIKITTYIIGFYSDQNVEILCRQMMENVILDSINNLENYPFVDGIKLARKLLLFILKAFEKVSVFQIQMDWIQVNPWIDMTCTLINKISQFDFSLIDDNVDDDDDNLDKDISIIYETLVSVLYQINQIIKIFDDTIQHMNVFKAFLVREDIQNLLKNLHKNFQKNQNLVTVLREIGFSNDEINIMLN